MFSKIELAFLKSPENFSADYARVLRHRIKIKSARLQSELILLEDSGTNITRNCNGVTEFCNGQQNKQNLNQVVFGKREVRLPGFEPGHSAWEADVLPS